MSDWVTPIVLAVLAALLVFLVVVRHRSSRERCRRALKRTERQAVAAAADGKVGKVVGKLRFDDDHRPLESLLRGRPCAYYTATVQKKRQVDERYAWVTILEETRSAGTALLEDDGGRALVTLGSPEVVLSEEFRWLDQGSKPATARLQQQLAELGELRNGVIADQLQFTEGVVPAGETVAVLGLCRWENDPDPAVARGDYRTAPRRLVIEPPEQDPLIISCDPSTF